MAGFVVRTFVDVCAFYAISVVPRVTCTCERVISIGTSSITVAVVRVFICTLINTRASNTVTSETIVTFARKRFKGVCACRVGVTVVLIRSTLVKTSATESIP